MELHPNDFIQGYRFLFGFELGLQAYGLGGDIVLNCFLVDKFKLLALSFGFLPVQASVTANDLSLHLAYVFGIAFLLLRVH